MANLYDWLTLPEGKAILSIKSTSTNQDTLVAGAISGLSRRLDAAVGPAVKVAIANEVHDGGFRSIELKAGPVTSVSSVVEYQSGAQVIVTQSTPGTVVYDGFYSPSYRAQPELSLLSGILHRTASGYRGNWATGVGNVVVSYLAGRYTDTASVDPLFKEACAVALKNWYRMYEESIARTGEMTHPNESFPKFAIPNASKHLLHHVWQPEIGFGAS